MAKVSTPTDNGTGAYSLDTLAQLRKVSNDKGCSASQISFQKRSRAKVLTDSLIFRLVDQDSPMNKSYWQTYWCTRTILQDGITTKSRYCNQRFCLVCNRIRTARLINGYSEQLSGLENPYFVTLTTRNVQAVELRERINLMAKNFVKLKDRLRKQGIKLKGIRKIECTYNPKRDDYHPHYHLIVEGCRESFTVVSEWIKTDPTIATIQGQDIRYADQSAPTELFKYFTKMLSNSGTFYAKPMDVIFRAMKGKRVFQPFGGIKRCSEDVEVERENTVDWKEPQTEIWTYEKAAEYSDWYNSRGESFSEVRLTDETMQLIDRINPTYFTDNTDIHKLERKQQENRWENEDANHNPTQKGNQLQPDLTSKSFEP